jgi:hypothetical protein
MRSALFTHFGVSAILCGDFEKNIVAPGADVL